MGLAGVPYIDIIYIYIYTYIYTHTYKYIRVYIYIYVHVHVHVYTYVACLFANVYTYLYVYMHMSMYPSPCGCGGGWGSGLGAMGGIHAFTYLSICSKSPGLVLSSQIFVKQATAKNHPKYPMHHYIDQVRHKPYWESFGLHTWIQMKSAEGEFEFAKVLPRLPTHWRWDPAAQTCHCDINQVYYRHVCKYTKYMQIKSSKQLSKVSMSRIHSWWSMHKKCTKRS